MGLVYIHDVHACIAKLTHISSLAFVEHEVIPLLLHNLQLMLPHIVSTTLNYEDNYILGL